MMMGLEKTNFSEYVRHVSGTMLPQQCPRFNYVHPSAGWHRFRYSIGGTCTLIEGEVPNSDYVRMQTLKIAAFGGLMRDVIDNGIFPTNRCVTVPSISPLDNSTKTKHPVRPIPQAKLQTFHMLNPT